MQPLRLALLFAALQAVSPAPGVLRVMHVSPATPAEPDAQLLVIFDRPVAAGLDATIDPASIFRLEPAVAGRLEWRDPVTIRFTPSEPLEPGAVYTITISPDVRAVDGSALERAYRHTFRVSPPRVLTGSPVRASGDARHLPERPVLKFLVSSPVDPSVLAQAMEIRLSAACGGGSVALRPLGIRLIDEEGDPVFFRYTGFGGPYPRDPARDLRRVVELVPAAALPLGCSASLGVPRTIEPGAERVNWSFWTYGPLRLASVECAGGRWCATGPVRVHFSTPVRGGDVLRHVRLEPGVPFTARDTAEESATWILDARLGPRQHYAVVVDTALVDVFGQRLEGVNVRAFITTGFPPSVTYEYGRLLVERNGLGTLAVQHVNVDTLEVHAVPVPDSMEAAFLGQSWGWEAPFQALDSSGAAVRWSIPVAAGRDERHVTGVRISRATRGVDGGAAGSGTSAASGANAASHTSGRTPPGRTPVAASIDGPAAARPATLYAVKVGSAALDSVSQHRRPIALVQVTDLAVHARIGVDQAVVWVTGVSDGLPRPGAVVTLHDAQGRIRATGRTGPDGLAVLDPLPPPAEPCEGWMCANFYGYVAVTLGDDRAVVGVTAHDPDLAPWRFNVSSAWGTQRVPAAATVFTERGIYRPGEVVHAKAIVRDGPLGSLRAPSPGDSIRWVFRDRENGILEEATAPLSAFGTADRSIRLAQGIPLGHYQIVVHRRRDGEWEPHATTHYQVAEYRPPEFLVDVVGDDAPRLTGDTVDVHVAARYLFGAPMARAPVRWTVRQRPISPWELEIPGADGYRIGAGPSWWDDAEYDGPRHVGEGVDTLDAGGRHDLRLPLPEPVGGRPSRVDVIANVVDANRQTVAGAASFTVHPAEFYVAARPRGDGYFWTAGSPVTLDVLAVRPDGGRVAGVAVRGTVVRREWHRVRRYRGGTVQEVGGWVADTVATCAIRTGAEPVACTFTPPAGGAYTVTLTAEDTGGRTATTRFSRWASGSDWVPWNDDSQLKMDVIPDRERYAVGDTATLFLASPFTDAETWITVERERVLESRRIRIGSGATTIRLPITEAHAPNVFVSVVVIRGRSAAPGPLDDPGCPTLRVGYADLRVTPEVKRLDVRLRPERSEYRPGDMARVHLTVRDAAGRGERAEVTLWAVDEGVLALTGYRTPDPIDLLYPARGVGVRLASNLVSVAAQVPDGQKGRREPGGGGGDDVAGILRSRFESTAFFLGSVVTDADGNATAAAKLPDNLTTFRVMAVAVTAGDRYGSGHTELLVTRPLVARPALPRFVREGDRFSAGVVLNSRMGGTPRVRVDATASGIRLEGRARKDERLEAGRGREVRFDFTATPGDSARFQFAARAGGEADAVAHAVPIRPNHYPLTQTIAGVLHDTASILIPLQDDVDPSRSRLEIDFGASSLAFLQGAWREMQLYPYACTEQIGSAILPLIALYGAEAASVSGAAGGSAGSARGGGSNGGAAADEDEAARARARTRIEAAVRTLTLRQRADGGIGYWGVGGWTSPWLSAYAGRVLLEAKAVGIEVDTVVLSRLGDYLAGSLRRPLEPNFVVARWQGEVANALAERLAAADYLSRIGRPDVATENSLLQQAGRLHWEDRVLLAEVVARRGRSIEARALLEHALASVRVEGRTAVFADSTVGGHYFGSRTRPIARLLSALLTVEPAHPLVGPVVESLVDRGRAGARSWWNPQDYGFAALALRDFEAVRRVGGPTRVRIEARGRTVLDRMVVDQAASSRATPSARAGVTPDAQARATQGAQVRATPGGEDRAGPIDGRTAPGMSVPLDGLVESGPDGRPVVRLSIRGEGAPLFYYVTVREAPKGLQLQPVDRGIRVERWYEDVRTGEPIVSVKAGELVRVRLRVTVPSERHFVVLDDPLPAGLEPVDLSLRTVSPYGGEEAVTGESLREQGIGWAYGAWDAGIWSPFDHKELRDDRVVYSATVLWPGTHSATYLARATTVGTFLYPPTHAEEMYNPGVNGRSAGGEFTVVEVRE